MPSSKFYNRKAWRRASQKAIAKAGFVCTRCGVSIAASGRANVHHVYPVKAHPVVALEPANHRALCVRCHAQLEAYERTKVKGCDINGYPTAPNHPWFGARQ